MAYIPNEWKDQVVQRPKTYQMNNNDDGSVTLIDSFGLVTELGTPVNADHMNHIEEGIAQVYEDVALKDEVLFKNQITNCILEAPNGVATYSGTTITLKQGLKVLAPNGRNADGTLNNIEYTVQQDMTLDVAVADKWNGIYGLKASGIFDTFAQSEPISIQDEQPSVNKGYWYSPKLNRNYFYHPSLSYWEEIKMVLLGKYTFNSNYTSITEFTTINTVDLLKRTDKPDVTSWGYPTNKKIELTIPNPNIPLTAPDNGYVHFHNESTSSILHGIFNQSGYVASYSNSIFFEAYVPVKKGDKVSVFYTELNDPFLRFIYAKGAQE